MTRFDADLHRLATQLATMAAAPSITTAADDTDLVNRARRTLRTCCRKMLTDLAPDGRSYGDGHPDLPTWRSTRSESSTPCYGMTRHR